MPYGERIFVKGLVASAALVAVLAVLTIRSGDDLDLEFTQSDTPFPDSATDDPGLGRGFTNVESGAEPLEADEPDPTTDALRAGENSAQASLTAEYLLQPVSALPKLGGFNMSLAAFQASPSEREATGYDNFRLALANEPRDDVWAPEQERRIQLAIEDTVSRLSLGVSLAEVECRAILCGTIIVLPTTGDVSRQLTTDFSTSSIGWLHRIFPITLESEYDFEVLFSASTSSQEGSGSLFVVAYMRERELAP